MLEWECCLKDSSQGAREGAPFIASHLIEKAGRAFDDFAGAKTDEDLHDGASFELFLEATNQHPRANILFDPSHFVLQQLDYLDFIDRYHSRIKMFHVKDAEFRPNGRSGAYGGYQNWVQRPGRFRSLG